MKKKEKKSTKENTRKGVPKTYYRKILKEVVDQSEKFGTNTSCVEQGGRTYFCYMWAKLYESLTRSQNSFTKLNPLGTLVSFNTTSRPEIL